MKHLSWPVVVILAGLALVAVAPLAVPLTPAAALWSDADAAQYQKASAAFHAARYNLPGEQEGRSFLARNAAPYDPVAAKAQYEAAKAEFERQQSRLDAARARPRRLMWCVRLAGMLLTAAGVFGLVRHRRKAGDQQSQVKIPGGQKFVVRQ